MARRLLILIGVLAIVVSGGATGAQGGKGAEQLAAGTGTLVCCGEPMVHVNAQSGDGGVEPRGHFWIRYPSGVEFGGRVVCLDVTGNVAGLTGRIDRVKTGNPIAGFVEGNFMRIRITDMGSPGTFDLVNFDPGTTTQPAGCSGVGDLAIAQGNYVVHDKPVLSAASLEQLLAQFEDAADDPYGSG